MPSVDWYFDFISPFAYLQCEQLAALRRARAIRYQPILFAAPARTRTGTRAPRRSRQAHVHLPLRARGRRSSWASRSSSRPSIRSIRCRCCASRSPATAGPRPCSAIFRFVWRDGRLPDLPIEWAELVHDVGARRRERAHRRSRGEGRACARNTDEAIARGVFGVPTLAIGDELFWGADATDMARRLRGAAAAPRRRRIRARRRRCRRAQTREHAAQPPRKHRALIAASGPRQAGIAARTPACAPARDRRVVEARPRAAASRVCSPCAGAGAAGLERDGPVDRARRRDVDATAVARVHHAARAKLRVVERGRERPAPA